MFKFYKTQYFKSYSNFYLHYRKIKSKNDFSLAAQKRSKLWINDLYLYLRLFAKYGAKRPIKKKLLGSKV